MPCLLLQFCSKPTKLPHCNYLTKTDKLWFFLFYYSQNKNSEPLVMDFHPRIVQIPQLTNLRHLFYEFSFDWHVSSRGFISFSHSYFCRSWLGSLINIKTTRESTPFYNAHCNVLITATHCHSDYWYSSDLANHHHHYINLKHC